MKISKATVYEFHVPFKFTFKHAGASRSEGSAVLVRMESDDGAVGWGESAPRSYVTGETTESVVDKLRRHLKPQLGTEFESFDHVVAKINSYLIDLPRDAHAAFCAVELALLDIAGKVFEKSAGEVVGPIENQVVEYSAVITAGDLEQAKQSFGLARKFGIKSAKLKVGVSEEADYQVLQMAREILGQKCGLRLDANFAWSPEEALKQLEKFAVFHLEGVEQPIAADDIDGHIWLTERSPIPVIVDETLVSFEDAQMLASRKGCHMFNIRISKCGGLCNSTRIRGLAEQTGIKCMMGAQVGETAILTAAGRHFATRSKNLRFLEGSFGKFLLENDIVSKDLSFGPQGKAGPIGGFGLGIEIDESLIEPCVGSKLELRAD